MKKYTLIDNSIVEKSSAFVSSEDRSFRFADSTFQSIKIHSGILYDLDYYIDRLISAAKTLQFNPNFKFEELKVNLIKLVAKNNIENGTLRVNLSRGSGSMGYLPAPDISTSIAANCYELKSRSSSDISIGTSDFTLWDLPTQFCAVKNMRSVNYVMAKMTAHEKGNYDDVILTKDGKIAECSSANIFWVKDSVIYTPDETCGLYPGHIRSKIIANPGFKVELNHFHLKDLINSDEIFLTNSNILVKPVKNLKIYDLTYEKGSKVTDHVATYLKNDLEKYCKIHG